MKFSPPRMSIVMLPLAVSMLLLEGCGPKENSSPAPAPQKPVVTQKPDKPIDPFLELYPNLEGAKKYLAENRAQFDLPNKDNILVRDPAMKRAIEKCHDFVGNQNTIIIDYSFLEDIAAKANEGSSRTPLTETYAGLAERLVNKFSEIDAEYQIKAISMGEKLPGVNYYPDGNEKLVIIFNTTLKSVTSMYYPALTEMQGEYLTVPLTEALYEHTVYHEMFHTWVNSEKTPDFYMIPNKKFALDQLENFVHTMHKNEVAAEVFGALMVVKEAEAGAAHEAAMQFVTQRPVLSAVNTDNFQKQVQKMNSAQIDTSNPKNYSNLYYTTAPALTDVVIRLSKESFRKKLKAMSVIEVAELSCDIAEKNALSFTELQYLLTPDRVELKNTARIRSIKQQAKIGYGTVFTNDLQMGQSIMQMSVDFFMAREKQIGGVSTEGAMKKLFTYQPKFKDYFTADGKSRAPMPPKPQTNFYVPNISGGPGGL